ncbi:Arf GTPase activating protein [Dillenia turbinata]|uniref:Arf GTPase activating protein n=1 Tax=Dillenia turbinata TaxID=194707 RepID=A0AAN8ZP70_9MAGN
MASQLKEDEKNERIIRGLLKLPANRRCMNCNSLGPQYVCTNFWTFVCTTCSGIHREFTHRVKSVSMAKFTPQEVSALQGGGNETAKEIYLKEWDAQRQSFPDSSNIERLRDFIKHVYVDRRYTGEKNFDKPPRAKSEKEDSYDRRFDKYQGGSRSPPYDGTDERRYNDRSSPGGRFEDRNRAGYDQEYQQSRSPARAEVINDWRREDRFGNSKRSEDRRFSDSDYKVEGRSPDRQKDVDSSSPPVVRPVRDILGENVIPLRISEPPKANGSRAADGSLHAQRTASSSSLGSSNGNPVEVKVENPVSLIDFDTDPEPPIAAASPPTQQTMGQNVAQPTYSSSNDNWASFDVAPEAKVSQAPTSVNPLEDMFLNLTVSALEPVQQVSGLPNSSGTGTMSMQPASGNMAAAPFGQLSMSPVSSGFPVTASVNNLTFSPPVAPGASPGSTPVLPVSGVNSVAQWPTIQHQQHSLFPGTGSYAVHQQNPVVGPSSNQPWNAPVATNRQAHVDVASVPSFHAVSKPGPDVLPGNVAQTEPANLKSAGRKELPEDLFTAINPSFHMPMQSFQAGLPRAMGFSMQYMATVPLHSFPQQSRSINPFDISSEPSVSQAPVFPSVGSLQGGLPNAPPQTGLLRTHSLGAPMPTWMPPHSSSHPLLMPPQALPHAISLPPGQQVPNNMPPSGHQGVGSFGGGGGNYGTLNSIPQVTARNLAPNPLSSFPSVGGNPFG